MQFAFTEEQSLLQQAVQRFATDRYGNGERRRNRAEPAGYSRDNWRLLGELGVLALLLPAESGGAGGSARDLTAVMDAVGNGLVIEPVLEEILMGALVLTELGSPAQRNEWGPRLAAGESHVALAHFEQSARFNLADVRTRAQPRTDGWSLSGEKSLIPCGASADLWVVSARERGEPDDEDGIGFFLVDPRAEGIERRDYRLTDGAHASTARLRNTQAVARLPGGFAAFSRCADLIRLGAAAEMTGVMARMLDATLEYLRTRKQFGASLSSFQAIQHRLANLYVRLEQSRSQVCRAALHLDGGVDGRASVAGMKSYVGRAAVELAESCVHLHGGMGMSDELELGAGYKRLLVLAMFFGDADSELRRFSRLREADAGAALRCAEPAASS